MGADKEGKEKNRIEEIKTPEPPQRMYPLEAPFEEQTGSVKKHGIKSEQTESKK